MKGTRLLRVADFHLGTDASLVLPHELIYPELIKKKPPPPVPMGGAPLPPPPPPPPRTRKGSTFPLQVFGTRLFKSNNVQTRKTSTIVGTMDGSIGLLIPLDERMYKRLALLQQIMCMVIPTSLALNPKDFRLSKNLNMRDVQVQAGATQGKKAILDGTLLSKFLHLDAMMQEQIANMVGVTAFIVKENLHEIDYTTRFF